MSGIIIAERCHYCSKQKPPKDVIRRTGGVAMCTTCWHWHLRALDALAGNQPAGCQRCHLSHDELERRSRNGDVPYTVIPLDDIYALLCKRCADTIIPKRGDLIKNTAYGQALKVG